MKSKYLFLFFSILILKREAYSQELESYQVFSDLSPTTSDYQVYDLKGRVRRVCYHSYPPSFDPRCRATSFDTNGRIHDYQVKRNSKGQLVMFGNSEINTTFTYTGYYKIKDMTLHDMVGDEGPFKFEYHSDRPTYELKSIGKYNYEITKRDAHGNWIERRVSYKNGNYVDEHLESRFIFYYNTDIHSKEYVELAIEKLLELNKHGGASSSIYSESAQNLMNNYNKMIEYDHGNIGMSSMPLLSAARAWGNIEVISANGNRAIATVILSNMVDVALFPRPGKFTLSLVCENGNWLIDDVTGNGYNMREHYEADKCYR